MEQVTPGINIWSGTPGLGGALTNMTERAREKGNIQNSYPVRVNGRLYPDAEAAYQALKQPGNAAFNDGLMIDIIALKFLQHSKLQRLTTERGGLAWLGRCSHFTQARSASFASWEGQGISSRFIANLMHGYQKSLSGVGPVTRVVHVKEAPYDIYIGRGMPDYLESPWHNPFKTGTTLEKVTQFHRMLLRSPELLARVGELKGKTLGCWCKTKKDPHALCHGDVLVALAEGQAWEPTLPAQGALF